MTTTKSAKMTRQQLRLARRLDQEAKAFSRKWASHLNIKFKAYGLKAKEAFLHLAHVNHLKAQSIEFDWTDLTDATATGAGSLDLDYRPMYLSIARTTYKTINDVLGLSVNMDAQDEQDIIALGGKWMGLVDLPQQTKDAIFKAIQEGRAEGEGAADIANRILDAVAAGPWSTSEMRATMIARTETKFAQNAASIDAYESADNVDSVMVYDGRLPTSDEECMARDGTEVSFDEARAMADDEHPNGTLSFAPIVENAFDNGGT